MMSTRNFDLAELCFLTLKVNVRRVYMEVVCADALEWLLKKPDKSLTNIVTGIPDPQEMSLDQNKYREFLAKVVGAIFDKVMDETYVMFMVTDRKKSGEWLDKSYLIQKVAEEHNMPLKWHKIILHRDIDACHIQRPTYQHYLCFSRKLGPGSVTADVMLCGKKGYKNGSSPVGTQHAIEMIRKYSPHKSVIDPFVGRGTTLVEARRQGLLGIGIDLSLDQCKRATGALEQSQRL